MTLTPETTHEALAARLGKHLSSITASTQAPHCGHHHITFTATEHQLRRLLKAAHYGHAHVAANLEGDDERIVYRISIPGGDRFLLMLEYLEGDSIQRMRIELVYMENSRVLELLSKFCQKCGAGEGYCRCRSV